MSGQQQVEEAVVARRLTRKRQSTSTSIQIMPPSKMSHGAVGEEEVADARPADANDDDVPLNKRSKVDKAAAEASMEVAASSDGRDHSATGRTRRKANDIPEQRSLRQRTAKESAKKEDKDKGSSGGRGCKHSVRGSSEKAPGRGAARGRGRGRGRGGNGLGRRRDLEEEVEPDPEPDQDPEELVSEDHVLISFTSGNSFAEGSVVLITPAETVETAVESDFSAKIAKYNVERKILKLVYEGSRREDYDAYVNHVLKVGSTIACSDGNACAKIQELDAEWHRGQPWAIDNEFLDKVVRWEVKDHMDCGIGEQDGVVWGWLPANESEYYMQHEPEEKGGKPKPLWRVKFSADIMPCDLDEHELAKALEFYATKDARGAAAAKGTKTKRQLLREQENDCSEEWVPDDEVGSKRKKTEAGDEIDDDVPIIKRKVKDSKVLDDEAPVPLRRKKLPAAKSSETNGDTSKLKHEKTRGELQPVPAVKGSKEGENELTDGKEKVKKDPQDKNGSSGVGSSARGTETDGERGREGGEGGGNEGDRGKEKSKLGANTEKKVAHAADGVAISNAVKSTEAISNAVKSTEAAAKSSETNGDTSKLKPEKPRGDFQPVKGLARGLERDSERERVAVEGGGNDGDGGNEKSKVGASIEKSSAHAADGVTPSNAVKSDKEEKAKGSSVGVGGDKVNTVKTAKPIVKSEGGGMGTDKTGPNIVKTKEINPNSHKSSTTRQRYGKDRIWYCKIN